MEDLLIIPFMLICYGIPILIAIGGTIFWVVMLIDVIKRVFPKDKENERIMWVLIIALTNCIGALIYFFMVKNNKEYN